MCSFFKMTRIFYELFENPSCMWIGKKLHRESLLWWFQASTRGLGTYLLWIRGLPSLIVMSSEASTMINKGSICKPGWFLTNWKCWSLSGKRKNAWPSHKDFKVALKVKKNLRTNILFQTDFSSLLLGRAKGGTQSGNPLSWRAVQGFWRLHDVSSPARRGATLSSASQRQHPDKLPTSQRLPPGAERWAVRLDSQSSLSLSSPDWASKKQAGAPRKAARSGNLQPQSSPLPPVPSCVSPGKPRTFVWFSHPFCPASCEMTCMKFTVCHAHVRHYNFNIQKQTVCWGGCLWFGLLSQCCFPFLLLRELFFGDWWQPCYVQDNKHSISSCCPSGPLVLYFIYIISFCFLQEPFEACIVAHFQLMKLSLERPWWRSRCCGTAG